jgi:hypothetical protein
MSPSSHSAPGPRTSFRPPTSPTKPANHAKEPSSSPTTMRHRHALATKFRVSGPSAVAIAVVRALLANPEAFAQGLQISFPMGAALLLAAAIAALICRRPRPQPSARSTDARETCPKRGVVTSMRERRYFISISSERACRIDPRVDRRICRPNQTAFKLATIATSDVVQ